MKTWKYTFLSYLQNLPWYLIFDFVGSTTVHCDQYMCLSYVQAESSAIEILPLTNNAIPNIQHFFLCSLLFCSRIYRNILSNPTSQVKLMEVAIAKYEVTHPLTDNFVHSPVVLSVSSLTRGCLGYRITTNNKENARPNTPLNGWNGWVPVTQTGKSEL